MEAALGEHESSSLHRAGMPEAAAANQQPPGSRQV